MMRKMDFDEKWVKMGRVLVYDILKETYDKGNRRPHTLFIICAEGLSVLLKKLEARGEIHGIKVCRGAPLLTHLLFVDDCFLFCRANEKEAQALSEALKKYEEASRQPINLQKSKIIKILILKNKK